LENSRAINKLQDIVERTSNDVKMLVKHFQMVQTQIDQLIKVQKDLLVNASREKQACKICTRGGASTQDPLYPKGHPKRIEQDSQRTAGAIIDCNQGKVTFNVNDKEHMVYFPKNIDRKYALNSIKNIETIKVGQIYCSELKPKEEYQIVIVGTMPIKVEVT
jgi:hypothetical protein